jgi:hypothetical protein
MKSFVQQHTPPRRKYTPEATSRGAQKRDIYFCACAQVRPVPPHIYFGPVPEKIVVSGW